MEAEDFQKIFEEKNDRVCDIMQKVKIEQSFEKHAFAATLKQISKKLLGFID